jgi:hypothetical protein
MNISFTLQGLTFEWDSDKAEWNLKKHGVSFEEAAEVFFDPFYQTGDASRETEQRDFLLGYSTRLRILLVVYTERERRTRIISARAATHAERKIYEQAG